MYTTMAKNIPGADTEDALRAARDAPPCTRVGEYLQSFCTKGRGESLSLTQQRVDCAKGVSSSLTREQAVQLASRLHKDVAKRSLETATKADLCALVADEMIENVTRAMCVSELARHADSKTRLALAASTLTNDPFHSIADLSRESLCLIVGSSMTSEQRASAMKSSCARDIVSAIPWRELGQIAVKQAKNTDKSPCTPKCLVDFLHFLVTMLCTKSKEEAVIGQLSLLGRVALTPADVWNTLAAMGGSDKHQPEPLQHSVRSACLQKFLKSNRSRVYDESSYGADHAVNSSCVQLFKKGDPKAYEGAVFPKSHPVGSACVMRLDKHGKPSSTCKGAPSQAPVAGSRDEHINRLLFTANPSSRVGNVSAITLCG
eukprot:jgi/Mesvir1/18224/Mv09503-RA.1